MVLRIVIDVLLAVGAFFALVGTLGILRMPDTFCRMQASTCVNTMGVIGLTVGALLYAIFLKGDVGSAVKIGVIGLLILVTNPIGSHSIAKGAYKAGIRPEKPMQIDDLGRDSE